MPTQHAYTRDGAAQRSGRTDDDDARACAICALRRSDTRARAMLKHAMLSGGAAYLIFFRRLLLRHAPRHAAATRLSLATVADHDTLPLRH